MNYDEEKAEILRLREEAIKKDPSLEGTLFIVITPSMREYIRQCKAGLIKPPIYPNIITETL